MCSATILSVTEITYDYAAGAADRGTGAGVARPNTDDGDWAADETDQDIEVLENHTDALQNAGSGG